MLVLCRGNATRMQPSERGNSFHIQLPVVSGLFAIKQADGVPVAPFERRCARAQA